ncbi:hypothetical protein ABFP35_08325 [Acinetobacter baumannii]|uniref:hypothetical protein n=1 Tax=Acinetobacter baumannii TaxID=470 RepID=UPI0029721ED4|nr:hypothetical protein [Acinetobacter baumannii]
MRNGCLYFCYSVRFDDINGELIAQVDREKPLAMNKWHSTKAKVLDAVNKLLGKLKIN